MFKTMFSALFTFALDAILSYAIVVLLVTFGQRFVAKTKPETRFGYDFAENCKKGIDLLRRIILWCKDKVVSFCEKHKVKDKAQSVWTAAKDSAITLKNRTADGLSAMKVKSAAASTARAEAKAAKASAKAARVHAMSTKAPTTRFKAGKRLAYCALALMLLLNIMAVTAAALPSEAVPNSISSGTPDTGALAANTNVVEQDSIPDAAAAPVGVKTEIIPAETTTAATTTTTAATTVVTTAEPTTTAAPTTTTAKPTTTTTKKTTTTAAPSSATTKKTTTATTTTTSAKPVTTTTKAPTTTTTQKPTTTTAKPTTTTAKPTTTTTAAPTTTVSAGGWASVSEMEADMYAYAESFGLYYADLSAEMPPEAEIYSELLGTSRNFRCEIESSIAFRAGLPAGYECFQIKFVSLGNNQYVAELYYG